MPGVGGVGEKTRPPRPAPVHRQRRGSTARRHPQRDRTHRHRPRRPAQTGPRRRRRAKSSASSAHGDSPPPSSSSQGSAASQTGPTTASPTTATASPQAWECEPAKSPGRINLGTRTNPGNQCVSPISRQPESQGSAFASERMASVIVGSCGTDAISSASARPMPGTNFAGEQPRRREQLVEELLHGAADAGARRSSSPRCPRSRTARGRSSAPTRAIASQS